MKKQLDVTRNVVKKISDEDVSFIYSRLRDRYSGDIAAVLEFVQSHSELDRIFSAAKTSDELFACLDNLYQSVESDMARRFKQS